jgi:hypothetical protein
LLPQNMAALREATLDAGKFAWQMMWTGGDASSIGDTGLGPIVTRANCARARTLSLFARASFFRTGVSSRAGDALASALAGGSPRG